MEIIKHKYCDPFYTSLCDVSNSQHRDSSEAIIVNAIFMTFGFELISFNQSISPSIKCKLLQHRFNNASAPVQTDHFHRRIIVKNHVYGSSQLKVTCQPIIIPGSGYGGYAIKNGCAFSLDFKSLSSLQSFICIVIPQLKYQLTSKQFSDRVWLLLDSPAQEQPNSDVAWKKSSLLTMIFFSLTLIYSA